MTPCSNSASTSRNLYPGIDDRSATIVLILASLLCLPTAVAGQEDQIQPLEEVVVTATRSPQAKQQLPESVTVLGREEIEEELALSDDLGDVLGKHVPGMSFGNQSLSDNNQNIRGRDFLTLIDGVPQSTPLRNVQRDLRTIDPSNIERVEVIRGGTSIYGYGASGGLINIITKDADADTLTQESSVQFGGSEHDPGESLRGNVHHSLRSRSGKNRFRFAGTVGVTQSFFDGMGDRIPSDPGDQGGLAEADRYQFSGKWNRELDEERSLNLMANVFNHEQDRDFVKVAGDPSRNQKDRAVEGDPGMIANPGTENQVAKLQYRDGDFKGQELSANVYYQDYETIFDTFPAFWQSRVRSEKYGARLDLNSKVNLPAGRTINLIWGIDYLRDETGSVDLSRSGRTITPTMEQSSWAPFLQGEMTFGDHWIVRGGVRHEELSLDVESYTVHPSLSNAGNNVQGGELNYDETVFNLGVVRHLTRSTDVFARFSQSFSVADVGRTLRNTSASSVVALNPEAQVVDNYELGLRGDGDGFNYSLIGFFNESEVGTTFDNNLNIQRNPEQIWGAEAGLDHRIHRSLKWGGSLTLMASQQDADNDGNFETDLPNTRIPPTMVKGYAQHKIGPKWTSKLQFQYWGDEDGDASFGNGEVDSEILLDLLFTRSLNDGSLKIGVENLLDEFYFPVNAQATNFAGRFAAGRGRNVSVTYRWKW